MRYPLDARSFARAALVAANEIVAAPTEYPGGVDCAHGNAVGNIRVYSDLMGALRHPGTDQAEGDARVCARTATYLEKTGGVNPTGPD